MQVQIVAFSMFLYKSDLQGNVISKESSLHVLVCKTFCSATAPCIPFIDYSGLIPIHPFSTTCSGFRGSMALAPQRCIEHMGVHNTQPPF